MVLSQLVKGMAQVKMTNIEDLECLIQHFLASHDITLMFLRLQKSSAQFRRSNALENLENFLQITRMQIQLFAGSMALRSPRQTIQILLQTIADLLFGDSRDSVHCSSYKLARPFGNGGAISLIIFDLLKDVFIISVSVHKRIKAAAAYLGYLYDLHHKLSGSFQTGDVDSAIAHIRKRLEEGFRWFQSGSWSVGILGFRGARCLRLLSPIQ
jgi:hypothetical protein